MKGKTYTRAKQPRKRMKYSASELYVYSNKHKYYIHHSLTCTDQTNEQ